MTPGNRTSSNRFPAPHRAPGLLEELASAASENAGSLPAAGPGERRYQRAIDGWLAGRIRKQTRHWRWR